MEKKMMNKSDKSTFDGFTHIYKCKQCSAGKRGLCQISFESGIGESEAWNSKSSPPGNSQMVT
jgi:hypothetical protein